LSEVTVTVHVVLPPAVTAVGHDPANLKSGEPVTTSVTCVLWLRLGVLLLPVILSV